MFIVSIKLQIFNKISNFCFTTFIKLFASFNDTAVIELLLTESDINHIIKVNLCFKHKSKLEFTVYDTLKIM